MRKASEIKGLRITSRDDGTTLGTVRKLLFDENGDRLVALVISDRDLFGLIDARAVPFTESLAMGNDDIIVQSSQSLIGVHDDDRLAGLYDRANPTTGVQLYSTDGRDLGTLSDVFVDEKSGLVQGYELSGGVLSDMAGGRRFVNAPREVRYGTTIALVPPAVADELQSGTQTPPGGLQGVVAAAGAGVSGAYDSLATASVEQQKAYCVGKTASRDVVIPADRATMAVPAATPGIGVDEIIPPAQFATTTGVPIVPAAQDMSSIGQLVSGEILVRSGEIITQSHADRAASAGVLHQLVLAAGGDTLHTATTGMAEGASNTGASLQQHATAGADAAQQGLATAGEKAAGFFETVREKVSELVHTGREKVSERQAQREEQRIQDAIGRPVTRVILAPNDEIILNTGDMVTNKAIEHAQRTGVLELILDSLSTSEPEIRPEMLRARDEGRATLPTQSYPTDGPIVTTGEQEQNQQNQSDNDQNAGSNPPPAG